jgi:2-(1,2-epoxy-1,2-dihydrophenyl)acetyl-CoA isomerase
MYSTLELSVADGVATLVLNRPRQRNAIDMAMRQELLQAVHQMARDPQVQAVVLTGAGGHFCAGGDVKTMGQIASAEKGRQRMLDLQPLVLSLLQLDKPLVAAVEGVALGAGFGLALAADFIVAGGDARFCCSFARVGLVPDFATAFTLPRILGLQRAKALVFSARELPAAEALQQGLVTEVCDSGAALQRARELALLLANGSPTAFSLAKRMLLASFQSDVGTMLGMEADAQGIAYTSDYHTDAVQRFFAKKAPRLNWPAPASEPKTA